MRLEVHGVRGNGFTEIVVKHKAQEVLFSCKIYSKVRLTDPHRVFLELNGWLETLAPEIHDQMFEIYTEVRELYDMDFEPSHIYSTLTTKIVRLYKLVDLDSARRWLSTIGNIHIPSEVEDSITKDSLYNKKEQTYLKSDYVNLATVALGLRLMMPIWGDYIDQTTNQELYKETEVLGLLASTGISLWPINEHDADGEETTGAFDKISNYVKFCVDDKSTSLGSLWRGLSTVEIPIHLTAKVIVRRLTIVALNDHTSHSIVANMFKYVKSNLDPMERTTADKVKEKLPDSAGLSEDDKTSFIEGHKTKGRISHGDIVLFNQDTLDYEMLVERVDSTCCPKKLEACIRRINTVANYEIRPHQILLAQWVMAKAYPARAFPHIDKLSVNYLLASAQALLWHWGFLDVAVYLQVEPLYQGDYNSSNQLSLPKIGTRIAGKHKIDLDKAFPHMRVGRVANNGTQAPPENMSANAINSCTQSIRVSNWIYRGPIALYNASGQISEVGTRDKILIHTVTLKHSITEMVLHLASINH